MNWLLCVSNIFNKIEWLESRSFQTTFDKYESGYGEIKYFSGVLWTSKADMMMQMLVFIFNGHHEWTKSWTSRKKRIHLQCSFICRELSKLNLWLLKMKNCNIPNFLTLQNYGFSNMQCANYANKIKDLLEWFQKRSGDMYIHSKVIWSIPLHSAPLLSVLLKNSRINNWHSVKQWF
jgi:hypothetical protein